jgi:SAM-dependent methyltransferase
MDFFGRVETLQDDLEDIFRQLGIESCPTLPRRRSREGRKIDYDYDRFNIDEAELSSALVGQIRKIYHQDIELIEKYRPEPALQSSGKPEIPDSRSLALKFAGSGDLAPIEVYSRVNESHRDCLVYSLGNRGFYAEISTVARAMIYAWCHDLQLVLDCEEFAWAHEKGWADYFEPFCPDHRSIDPERIKKRVAFKLSGNQKPFKELRSYMPEEFDFGNTRLQGFQSILAFFMKLIFRPVADCQAVIDELSASLNLPPEYDAIHIRRGDKVGDEDVYYPTDIYLDRLRPLGLGRTLFVMSDSYQAVEEVRDSLQERNSTARVVSLIEPQRTGFDVWKLRRGEKFIGEGGTEEDPELQRAYIRDQTYCLIAETAVAMNSSRFVSTWLSNVGRMVWYLHRQPEDCVLLQQAELKDRAGKPKGEQAADIQGRPDGAWRPGNISSESLCQYRSTNEAEKHVLVYSLSSRSVAEELCSLAQAAIYARVQGLQLVLNTQKFRSSRGLRWRELFESFCLTDIGIDPGRIRKRASPEDQSFIKELEKCQPETLSFGQVKLRGFTNIYRYFLGLIIQPTADFLSRAEHLLAGLPTDEDFDVLLFETGNAQLPQCMDILGPPPANRLLVLISDGNMVEQRLLRQWTTGFGAGRLYSLIYKDQQRPVDSALFEMVQLIAALKSRYFVSNRTDAVSRIASLLHKNRQWCHLLIPLKQHRLGRSENSRQPAKYMAEVQLRNGNLYDLELPADSPLIRELKLAVLVTGKLVQERPASLIQLPIKSGRTALAFSSRDLSNLRLIPESQNELKNPVLGERTTEDPTPLQVPGPSPGKQASTRGHHSLMNISEGHLGGYISARHADSKKQGMEHGDHATWYPHLWDWVHEELGVRSVLDVGCGEGHSAAYFHGMGCRVLGIDGSERAKKDSFLPEFHLQHDYVDGPLVPDKPFDMVWCCEFVEHVEERFTQNFLATFASATKYIFMTFATPRQPGWHHVNCQHREYWVNKIERLGYCYDEQLTRKAREISHGHFSRSGLVFVRNERATRNLLDRVGADDQAHTSDGSLAINHMEVAKVKGSVSYLFLDIFVHPTREKVVAVMPCYQHDWDEQEYGIDFQNIELCIGEIRIKGNYIPHRLDSWEPCALLDFEDEKLTRQLKGKASVKFEIKAGPHRQAFQLSTLPEPSYEVLMSLVVKNENRWIRHFLEYYLQCLKVDHILVYDNGTDDQLTLLDILAPYREAGTVTYIPWDYRWRNIKAPRKMIAQPQQEAHSLNRFANARWIGFLDVDEFLRLPGKTLPGFLSDFEAADVDGLSFGLRWFHYQGVLEFDEIIDPQLTFLQAGRDELGRKRQKLMVSPARTRFLRLHTLEENRRELQVDDTDIFFHHYNQRAYRFKEPLGEDCKRDDFMLQFSRQLNLEGFGERQSRMPENESEWIRHIIRAIAAAEAGRSRLSREAMQVNGLCGTITRHFYNNICNFRGCRYLEIGSFEGASTVAATFANNIDAVCIDNFSQFHGTREKFEANIKRFPHEGNLSLKEMDCFDLDAGELGEFNVYLYDGAHSRENQYRAIAHFSAALAPLSIVIIDDWNWQRVREGTGEALSDMGIPVLYKKEIILPEEDLVDMPRHRGKDGWWNGICIMLLGRPSGNA